jgi:hypothetical protein
MVQLIFASVLSSEKCYVQNTTTCITTRTNVDTHILLCSGHPVPQAIMCISVGEIYHQYVTGADMWSSGDSESRGCQNLS